jgi:putative spermidine/putrescine transport system substrate-binding protein
MMKRHRGLPKVLFVLLLLPFLLVGAQNGGYAQQRPLIVNTFGGTFEAAWRRNVIEPFQRRFNSSVQTDVALTVQIFTKLRTQVLTGAPGVDVVMMDEVTARQAQREGLYDRLDPNLIPNLADQLEAFRGTDFFTIALGTAPVIAYNPKFIKQTPRSWKDLWKPEYRGKIAIPDINTTQGILFVLTTARINGGSIQFPDAAFGKLRELRPNIVTFWTSHDQLAQLFAQEQVWIAPWSNDRAQSAREAGVPITWVVPREGSYLIPTTIGIAKSTPLKDLAQKYLNLVLDKDVQVANARDLFILPSNKKAVLPPGLLEKLPTGPRFKGLLFPVDWEALSAAREVWVDRWNKEVLR